MTIYLNFYIIVYVVTLILLQFLLFSYVSTSVSNNSLLYLNYYITKFSKFKTIIYTLFLSLTGLPPFIFFFIKYNFLINLFFKLNFFTTLLIFFIFFLNMLFYIQIFFFKNINYNLICKKNNIKNNIEYSGIYFIVFFLLFILLNVFFFSDIFYILKIII